MKGGAKGLRRFLKGNLLIGYPTDSLARRKREIGGSFPPIQRLCIKIPHSLTLHFLFVELGPRDAMQVWRMASWGHENTRRGWWKGIPAASEQRDQLGPTSSLS